MVTPIPFTPAQQAHFRKYGSLLVLVPLEPQPVTLSEGAYEWQRGMFPEQYPSLAAMLPDCPYGQPGDRLVFREYVSHRYPETLVRFTPATLRDVQVKRLAEMTVNEGEQAGIPLPLPIEDWWDTQHPEHPFASDPVCWWMTLEAT